MKHPLVWLGVKGDDNKRLVSPENVRVETPEGAFTLAALMAQVDWADADASAHASAAAPPACDNVIQFRKGKKSCESYTP